MKFLYLFVFWGLLISSRTASQNYNVNVFLNDSVLNVSCNIILNDTVRLDYLLFEENRTIDTIIVDNKVVEVDYLTLSDTLVLDWNILRKIKLLYRINISNELKDSLIYFNRTSSWIPFIYDRYMPLTLEVITPKPFSSLSSNLISQYVKETTICNRFENNLNTHFPLLIFSSNKLNKQIIKNDEGTFYFYFSDKRKKLQRGIINEFIDTYSFFSDYYAINKEKTLTVVEVSGIDYVQSLNQFVLVGSEYIYYYSFPSMQFWPSHEVIHQWIGSGYNVYLKSNNKYRWFIEESLTEFLRYTYLEYKYGNDTLKKILKENILEYETRIKETNKDIPILKAGPDRITYALAPLFYYYIRKEIGEKSWRKFIYILYENYHGRFITYSNFKECLSMYLSAEEITKIETSFKIKGIPEYITDVIDD